MENRKQTSMQAIWLTARDRPFCLFVHTLEFSALFGTCTTQHHHLWRLHFIQRRLPLQRLLPLEVGTFVKSLVEGAFCRVVHP